MRGLTIILGQSVVVRAQTLYFFISQVIHWGIVSTASVTTISRHYGIQCLTIIINSYIGP